MASGKPEIVLLPGLDGTGDLFDRVVKFLMADLDVTVVRYPPDPTLGYAGYVELVRNKIGGRPVYVLGESFSGPVAVLVATQLRNQIKGVILVATFVKNPWPSWLIRAAAHGDPQKTPRWLRDAILMQPYGDPQLASKLDQIVRDLPRAVRNARLRAISGVDVRPDFVRLRCAVLALHGRGDWLVPLSLMQRAVRDKGGARMIVIPAPHMLLQTRPEEAAAEIVHFTRSSMLTETQNEA